LKVVDLLVDGQNRTHTYLRVSVTDRCNFRCTYCMPQEGWQLKPRAEILSLEEILRVAGLCVESGIEKIRITGGEPLIRHNIEWLIEKLAILPGLKTLGLTTNGALLKEKAHTLRSAGLQSVNISIDTLRQDRFQEITLRNLFEQVMNGIETALAVGFFPLKLNVVVMRGVNDDEIFDFVEFVRNRPINIRFIEFMPFKGNRWHKDMLIPYREMFDIIARKYDLIPQLSANPHTTAKDYTIDGWQGNVSFITPLSEDFCANCNRLRIAADGSIKSCLFYPAETNLRETLRNEATDEQLREIIQTALNNKRPSHPAEGELLNHDSHSMTGIGG
jgi:GTP 3',8-cyclase